MYAQKEKPKENKSRAVANSVVQKKNNMSQVFGFVDKRNEVVPTMRVENITKTRHAVQLKKGEVNDPHIVNEGEYKVLNDESIGDHIIVPNVSGCAAIKVNIFSGNGENQTLIQSIVMHSDALDASIEAAKEIGQIIKGLDVIDKSVSILTITNARWKSMGEHSKKVLSEITTVLKSENIVHITKNKQLTYGMTNKANIDLTGMDDHILERYADSIPNELERAERETTFSDYKRLLTKRREAGRHQRKVRKGRGIKNNPNYIEAMDLDQFALLRLNERKNELGRLKTALDSSESGCFLTTACTQYMKLGDDCDELTTLREFRDTYLQERENGLELIELYYECSPKIVKVINNREDEEEIFKRLYSIIRECVEAIKNGDNEYAFKTYCNMVMELKEKFIPEYEIPSYLIEKQKPITKPKNH